MTTATVDPVVMELPRQEPSWQSLGRYGGQNLAVAAAQGLGWALLLTALDRDAWPWYARASALLLFCLMMQGVFTLLHEFCHRNAHARPAWNYAIGFFTALLFGTSATFLQVQHWGHHRRNRTASERGEFIHPGEGALAKGVRYYFAILGGIWLACLVFPLLVPLLPYGMTRHLVKDAKFNSFSEAFREFTPRSWRRMQLEGPALWAWLLLLFLAGPWRPSTLLLAYGGFAFTWSSLQWVYHLHTPLHVVEGAYNLRLPLPLRALFLNFNCNLTHHRSPATPWQELHRDSDPRETQPLWYRYLLVFRPPVPFPSEFSGLEKRYF
jgi:fatty acid desaturase